MAGKDSHPPEARLGSFQARRRPRGWLYGSVHAFVATLQRSIAMLDHRGVNALPASARLTATADAA